LCSFPVVSASKPAILTLTLPAQDPAVDHISQNPVPSQTPMPHIENKPEPTTAFACHDAQARDEE